MMSDRMFAVVTGGGTSGHVIPAMSILEALIETGYAPNRLGYVGSRRGVETRLVPPMGVHCEFVSISGLQRSMSWRAVCRNLALPFRLARSTWRAWRVLKKWSPSVVVSVGGYASEPCARAARLCGIPVVCVSYDRRPGLATRRQARHAVACAVAFADSELPHAVHTGAPVRAVLRHLNTQKQRQSARERLGIGQVDIVVSVVGGSLGSRVLNDAVPEIRRRLREIVADRGRGAESSFTVWHVTGPRYAAEMSGSAEESLATDHAAVRYVCVPYHEAMEDLYAATDVLLCRAGASTVAEIATIGLAAVVVPWSGAAENHQELNAAWLGDAGAAVVVADNSSAETIATAVTRLVVDDTRRHELEHRARDLGEIHRGDSLVRVIVGAAANS